MVENNKNTYIFSEDELAKLMADALMEEISSIPNDADNPSRTLALVLFGTALGCRINEGLNKYKVVH